MKRFTSMFLLLCLACFTVGCNGAEETGKDEAKTGEALQTDPDYEKEMMGGGEAESTEGEK